MNKRKKQDRIPNLHYDRESGRYRYRNPITEERKWIGRDRERARDLALRANKAIAIQRGAMMAASTGAITVRYVIDLYVEIAVPNKPWADSTKAVRLAALELYKRDFGNYLIIAIDRLYISDWINARCKTFDCRNKHRNQLIDVWRFAISRKYVDVNEPEATYKQSGSKKIERNRKQRQRLSIEAFKQIHAASEPWFQVAMELALKLCQARQEIVNLKFEHVVKHDGKHWLLIIRQKTSGDSDAAFIRVAIDDQLQDLIKRARLSGLVSPYIVHRKSDSNRPRHLDNKPHRFYVMPDYLTKYFQAKRDELGLYDELEAAQRPSFHEIRSLGGRLLETQGVTDDEIRALMAHTDVKTTAIYLEDPNAITIDNYVAVKATMNLSEVLK